MRLKNVVIIIVFLALGIGVGRVAGPFVAKLSSPAVAAQISAGNYAEYLKASGKPLVMFSLSTCPHCADARKYLNKHKVSYKEYQIDKSSAALDSFGKLHEKGVPVFLTNQHKLVGFTAEGLGELLAKDGVVTKG